MSLRSVLLAGATGLSLTGFAAADENLFGWAKGAETLPQGKIDAYLYATERLDKGPAEGRYHAFDVETEIEYGLTDCFQISAAIEQSYFDTNTFNYDGDPLTEDGYRFGGVNVAGKYRFMSPYIDRFGFAVSQTFGYNWHDETAGIEENHFFLMPTLMFQKNFLDNTLISTLNLSADWAWGKRPAEAYDHEVGIEARGGVSYRFAPNWFIGLESRIRSEYPMFDLGQNEHWVVFGGPTLHYGGERWWATLAWAYQLYGSESDGQEVKQRAFAEQVQHEVRLKVGFNF